MRNGQLREQYNAARHDRITTRERRSLLNPSHTTTQLSHAGIKVLEGFTLQLSHAGIKVLEGFRQALPYMTAVGLHEKKIQVK